MKGAQSQTESHKDTLANLQASRELKIARRAATLSSAQKDYQERMVSFRQATSNVRGVITKFLNI
jgi:hypothetical protein